MSLNFNSSLSWQLQVALTPFQPLNQGMDNIGFNAANVDITVINQIFVESFTLAGSATQTLDMTSLTNLVGESVDFSAVYLISVTNGGTTDGNLLIQPGASNPLVWFFNGSSQGINLQNGDGFSLMNNLSGSGYTVSSTVKTLLFTNTGANSTTFELGIVGAT